MPRTRFMSAIALLIFLILSFSLTSSRIAVPYPPILRERLTGVAKRIIFPGKGLGEANDAMPPSLNRMAPLVLPARGQHTATVIFLHGLGDTSAGWADPARNWRSKAQFEEVKFILPTAPSIPITLNFGASMPGWFDIKSLGPSSTTIRPEDTDEDAAGILQSRSYLHDLIQQEISAGIPADCILLGGFSQGGALSIFAGLTAPFKVAGIVGLSSWLLLASKFKEHVPAEEINKTTPIFMGHGDHDPLVRYDLAKTSADHLKGLGYNVTLKTYRGMEHSACFEELDDVAAFIKARLPPRGK